MKCKYCKIDMGIGEAIDPGYDENGIYFAPVLGVAFDPFGPPLIEVWKCSQCGHSEYIDE